MLLLAGELTCAVMRCNVSVLWVDRSMNGSSETLREWRNIRHLADSVVVVELLSVD